MKRHLILGTAGHIDHGKTTLVKALTGIDADRLPEEKARGITIDLGFAYLDLDAVHFGIVDVPGHERFVHNMVAGATGIDMVLFVVAADDSVMPQSVEHLAILDLLGINAGLVAITKADLATAEDLDLVRAELEDLFAGTFLESAPVVPVSAHTGQGLDKLKQELLHLASAYDRPHRREVFRMPIDRVFTVQGHGTVVTGTVLSGTLRVGETMSLMPAEQPARVRGLQSHSREVPSVEAGERAAVNIAGVKVEEVDRGDELVAPGYLTPSRRWLTELKMLEKAAFPLKDRMLVRFHIGASEVTARVILKGRSLRPGESGIVEFRGQQPILADYGQRFIIRRLSPALTIAGGQVIDPIVEPFHRISDLEVAGKSLVDSSPKNRLDAFLANHDLEELTALTLASRLGIDPSLADPLIDELRKDKRLIALKGARGLMIHADRRDALCERILTRCQRELKRRQPSKTIERSVLIASCRRLARPATIEGLVDDLIGRQKLVAAGDRVGPPGARASLTKNQQSLLTEFATRTRSSGLAPPFVSEYAKEQAIALKELQTLVRVAVEDGLLVRIADDFYIDVEILDSARLATIEYLKSKGSAAVADLRTHWQISRKHAVPLCEYFDSIGVTKREGDVRVLGPTARVEVTSPTQQPGVN